jgi:murein DD-endopeptidase MepM/ murein hydrolase activator NlpD
MQDQKGSDKPDNKKGAHSGAGKNYKVSSDKDGKVTLSITGLDPKDTVQMELDSACDGENIPKGSFGDGAEDAEKQRLEKEEADRRQAEERQRKAEADASERKEREARQARITARRKEEFDRESANRAHVEKMTDNADNRWWRYILAIIIGAVIVWLSWAFFVCSDCMKDRMGDPQQNEFPISSENGEGEDSNYTEESDGEDSSEDEEISEDEEEEQTAETVPTFGKYQPADPALTLRILEYLSGPENPNFRFINGDSLDGENKYKMRAIQVATLIQSGLGVRFQEGRPPEEYRAIYTSANLLPEAGRMAKGIGKHTKYYTTYKNEKSFYWVVNSALESTPASSETDWSRAVEETLSLLEEKIRKEKIPSVNGRVTFALSKNSNASRTKGTTRRRSSSTMRTRSSVVVPANFYQNPVPGSTWKNNHWDGKTYAVDMMASKGTPIYASAGGKVIKSGYGGKRSGKRVTIRDPNADLFYGHLDVIYVRTGQKVKQGQLIGRVGHTGSAEPDSPHLHLEVFNRKVRNFPRPWTSWKQKQRRT